MDKSWSAGFPKRAIRWKKWSSARRGAHRGHDNWRTQGQHDPRNISLTLDTASFRREYELSRIDQRVNQLILFMIGRRVIELGDRKSIVYPLADIVQSCTLTEAAMRNVTSMFLENVAGCCATFRVPCSFTFLLPVKKVVACYLFPSGAAKMK